MGAFNARKNLIPPWTQHTILETIAQRHLSTHAVLSVAPHSARRRIIMHAENDELWMRPQGDAMLSIDCGSASETNAIQSPRQSPERNKQVPRLQLEKALFKDEKPRKVL